MYYYPPESIKEEIREGTHLLEQKVKNYFLRKIDEAKENNEIRPFDTEIIHQLYYNLCLGFVLSAPEYESIDIKPIIQSSFDLFWESIKIQE